MKAVDKIIKIVSNIKPKMTGVSMNDLLPQAIYKILPLKIQAYKPAVVDAIENGQYCTLLPFNDNEEFLNRILHYLIIAYHIEKDERPFDKNGYDNLRECLISKEYWNSLDVDEKVLSEFGNDTPFNSLMRAVRSDYICLIEYLLDVRGIDVNTVDLNKSTILHIEAGDGNLRHVEYLISRGADVNAVNRLGHTPLYEAVIRGHVHVVKYLVDRGADINADIINIASENGHIEIVKYLTKV
jgi:ankyrin repeat protein